MNDEEIEPTRVQYLDLVLEVEIGKIQASKSKYGRAYLIKLLTKLREEVNWSFADDNELKEKVKQLKDVLKELELERKKHARKGKAGRKPGKLKEPTPKQSQYKEFRKGYAHDWDEYLKYCDEKHIAQDEQYSTKGSFNKIKER